MLQGLSPLLTTFWNSPEQLGSALRWLTIVGILSTACFGTALYFVNDRIGVLQAAQISGQGDEIRKQKEILLDQSKTISEQDGQISHLTTEAAELAARAQDAERGISSTYDFNGGHRQSLGAGRVQVTVGRQAGVFQTIMKLYDDKDWSGLKKVCENEIKETPTWLTPYLFSGIAHANLGDLTVAVERLEFVVEKAGDDPHYADAARILTAIRSATRK